MAHDVALVTGSAKGIGYAIARRLLRDGMTVIVADIDSRGAESSAAELGDRAHALHLDVTSHERWESGVTSVARQHGTVSVLVNCAGIAGRSAPCWELSPEEWHQVIGIDLTGVFFGCRAVLPAMIDATYGRIVNIASIAGKEGNPNASPYSAAKSGVLGLTKSIAKEVAAKGILVNAVTPAVIETEILKQVTPEHIAYMTSRIPMGRVGQPEEVAALVSFLCSRELSFSTGAVFDISGGRATY
ncbi:MAG TPA: SDR family NAD(P)-dependent oxidoreductase [Thermomicrobiales bacterium]|nr:SDR family NAD(P)-dependent oxidoreductase [Thermomicrobiales bacterium]